jgi:hypothetical protein
VIGRVNPPEAQQTIAPIFSFLNTRPLKWRAHIPINFWKSQPISNGVRLLEFPIALSCSIIGVFNNPYFNEREQRRRSQKAYQWMSGSSAAKTATYKYFPKKGRP